MYTLCAVHGVLVDDAAAVLACTFLPDQLALAISVFLAAPVQSVCFRALRGTLDTIAKNYRTEYEPSSKSEKVFRHYTVEIKFQVDAPWLT